MKCICTYAPALFALIVAVNSRAQTNGAPTRLEETEEEKWAFSIATYAYLIPDGRDFVQPTITADYRWIHLEARYNYENLDTGSLWMGYNFSGGNEVAWEITPMMGVVFQDTDGFAPGYKGSLSWWKLEFYSEGQYLFDSHDSEESFLYNWSELTLAPVEWFRFGMVTQRLRYHDGDRDIQRGVLAGVTYKNVTLTGYVLNPDDTKPTVAVSLGVEF